MSQREKQKASLRNGMSGKLEAFNFSNSNIDLACEEVGKFLASAGVDRREALRLKLTFEEVLLEYQSKFGEDATYKLKCIKRFSAIRVEITVQGEYCVKDYRG